MATVNPEVRDCMTARVITVDVSDSVFDAAELIIGNSIGSVVVMRDDDVAGMVTKGDIMKNIILAGQDPKKTGVSSIMVTPVISISPDTDLEEAAKTMSRRNISKLPVIDPESGLLVGILTSTDVIRIEPKYVEHLADLIKSRSTSSSRAM
jgi:CBS domain-containing protein